MKNDTHLNPNWSLCYNGEKKTLDAWGITDCKRIFLNPGDDSLYLTQKITHTNKPFLAETPLQLYSGDQCIFNGLIVKLPIKKNITGITYQYEIKGPLWHLEHIVYQQHWIERDAATSTELAIAYQSIEKGRVVLGQNEKGQPLSLREQISDIIQYAADCGAPIKLGTIDCDGPLPIEELQDICCSEALMRVLRFVPDAVITYDYQNPLCVTLNIERFTQKAITPLSETTHPLIAWSVTPRHDRQVSGVILKYEKMHHLEGQAWSQTLIDAYPTNCDPKKPKTLIMTLELAGIRGQIYKQPIRVAPIEPENPLWWKEHLPSMRTIDFSTLVIHGTSRQSELPNELIQGGIADWMGCSVEEDLIQAIVSYETYEGMRLEETLSIKVHATSATNKTYTHTLLEGTEEPAPTGLAKILYESLSTLTYEGEITLHESQAPLIAVGDACMITEEGIPYGPLWVQGITHDIKHKSLQLKCGPGSLLKPDDFIEILRVNRQRQPLKRAYLRSAKQTPKSSLKQTTHTRLDNSDRSPQRLKRLVITPDQSTDRTIVLDAEQLPQNSRMELIEETVCHNGVIMNRLVLATRPYLK
jgi:hypothetical protein